MGAFEASWCEAQQKFEAVRVVVIGFPNTLNAVLGVSSVGAPTSIIPATEEFVTTTAVAPTTMPEHLDNLFVAGLAVDIEEQQVKDIFTAYGAVSRCRVLPSNGLSDRAALVQMSDVMQAR